MDKNIEELLKDKREQVVQFNVVNTTSNPIYLDLFNTSAGLSSIPSSPTYIFPPNTSVSTFGASAFVWLAINPINGYLYANDGSNRIQVFDTNNGNVFVTNIIIPLSNLTALVYNSVDNTVYVFDTNSNNFFVIDCNTNLVVATVVFGVGISSIVFIPSINSIYVGDGAITHKIDCSTNISSPTTLIYYDSYIYNSTNGYVYAVENLLPFFDVINPLNDTVIQSVSVPTSFDKIGLNPNTASPYVYCVTSLTGDLYVYDWNNSNSFVTIISPSIGQLFDSVYDAQTNNVYFGSNSGNILVVDSSNNFQTSFIALSLLFFPVLNPNQNSIYFASPLTNNINQITTTGVTSTNYYISGLANYNAFVNNLNNEPVFIQLVRIITQNQNQLTNQLQLTTIDSTGFQTFKPNFPINQVDVNQEQGNIGEIPLNNQVFDGRTYVNQYKINPFEIVSLEIYYKQLNLSSATPYFPILFKPKVQLKEYIKNELNL